VDPFNYHLKDLPIYQPLEEPVQPQFLDDHHPNNNHNHPTEEPSFFSSYPERVQQLVDLFPDSESLKFNTILPEIEIILSKTAKKAVQTYESLIRLAKEYNQTTELFETGKKILLEQITMESITNNIVTNSIISQTQRIYKFPDTLYIRIFVTLILLMILSSTSFKLLLLVLLISTPLCINIVKLVLASIIIKILCYLFFSKKKKENYIQESINLFEQQSSPSFIYVPITISLILLTLMKFDLLEGPLVWGGLSLVITSIFFWQQALVREKSPTNLWMVVAPLLLLIISMLLLSFRGNGLAYLWSYAENINLQNRAEIVNRKGEINYMKQSIMINSEYSELIDDYGSNLLTLERGYHYIPKDQRQTTPNKPKEPDKPTQFGLLWFNEENWTSTFFSALVPFSFFVLHFYIHAQNDVGQDVVVASVISAQKDNSNKDSQPPHYLDKIATYIMTTRLIPPAYIGLIIVNFIASLHQVVDWKHAVFLIAIYGLSIPTAAKLFSTLSTISWTSVATNVRGGPPQISRDYFFGNIVSSLATNHIRQVVCGTSIAFAIIMISALFTNGYSTITIVSLITPLAFCIIRYYMVPTDINYQTYLMISITLALQCYFATGVLLVAQLYTKHSIIFYTFNMKGKRNAILGQPESLSI
jgi:hypothetical protein